MMLDGLADSAADRLLGSAGNSHAFGEEAELFELQSQGHVQVPSGFICMLTLDSWAAWQQRAFRTSWGEFQKLLAGDRMRFPHGKLPFLFAGPIVEASAASVYCTKKDGAISGILLSSSDQDV